MGIRTCAKASETFSCLLSSYENRHEFLQNCRKEGKKVVGRLGYGVCEELILAAGLESTMVCADCNTTMETADRYLEYSFAPRARAFFDRLADGKRNELPDFVAVADSEDVTNRIYYYLREIKRSEPEQQIPELYLIDWLFSRHMMYQLWNEKALARFRTQLEAWSGTTITDEAVRAAMTLTNRQHAALKRLQALRRAEEPKISGSEALVIYGAGFFMEKTAYVQLLEQLAEEAESWPVIAGKRVFYTGSEQETTAVYDAIEAAGFVIVGEDLNWGDRSCERPCKENLQVLPALVDKYMFAAPTTQKGLVGERVAALLNYVEQTGAEAVVFYNEEYEEAASWDYPSQKQALEEKGVPSVNFCKMKYPMERNADFAQQIQAFAATM